MGVLAKEIEATYEVLSKMGEGGMGAVYKVRHRFFDEIRVIKVMQGHLEAVEELNERFLSEAKRGKQLRHPNLAEVIDFSVAADGTSYMVMEYIEGVNLREVLARNGGPLDYRFVVPIAEQALDALAFLHSRKFVHRDISPDNLMLTDAGGPEPRVKLIDLGIAKSLESTRHLTMAGKFIGKVRYASPEQFSGEVDARSDLYALGVVLYELLTGAKPITGEDYLSIIAGHVSRPPRTFTETDPKGLVPSQIRQAVMKALEKRPADRFQSAEAFADALRAAIPVAERRTLSEPIVTRPADRVPAEVTVRSETALTQPEASNAAAFTTRAAPSPFGAAPPPRTVAPAERTVPADSTPAPAVPPVTGPAPRRGGYGVAAIIALLVIGAAALLMLKPWQAAPAVARKILPVKAPVTGTIAGASVIVAAPPAASGELLINALPWGQVVSVRNGAGVEQLTATAETPLVLSLPAGPYKVQLTNPNSNRSVVLDATVTANALSRSEIELDNIDAATYVDSIGIGR